ncbi:MAG: hypothetical protein ACRC53_04735 [Plesiomonas sp.]|uniref:hypothetical protein n=1 Tax=Plesiomonas sp. TaxID=2486279 RepID=UPI003F30DA64
MISLIKKHIVIYSLLLLSFSTQASCWLVGDIKGYNSAGQLTELNSDTANKSKFIVKISNNLTKITPSNLNFISMGNKTAAGVYDEGNVTIIETWSISTDEKKVFISRIQTGNAATEGAKAFQGNVISRCP